MADEPYSKFYADAGHTLDIQTKSHVESPVIRAAYLRAKRGADTVTDQEMTVLTGSDTHVYRSNPLGPAPPDYKDSFKPLLTLIDNLTMHDAWSQNAQMEENRQIEQIATATGLDQNHVMAMARRYEKQASEGNKELGLKFGMDPQTPLKQEIAATLRKQAFGQDVTADETQKLQSNLAQFAKDEHYAQGAVQEEVAMFRARVQEGISTRRIGATEACNFEAQQIHNGHGEAFIYNDVQMDRNRAAIPQMNAADPKAKLAAWYVNPDDPPPNAPPGGAALGQFLISLHESEHLSRQKDTIAPKGLSADAREQAGEIDADKAILKFLDGERDTASKNYWLQARHVDSFTSGVISGDVSHDTATFLRVQEATGKQLDLDKFNAEKRDLLQRIVAKADLPATNEDYGRARTADVMGAVQAVLAGDKTETDPAKKLSAMQRAEAESFMKDAQAMGYTANPNFPKAKVANDSPAPARPAPALAQGQKLA